MLNRKKRIIGVVGLLFCFVLGGCGNQKTTQSESDINFNTTEVSEAKRQAENTNDAEIPAETELAVQETISAERAVSLSRDYASDIFGEDLKDWQEHVECLNDEDQTYNIAFTGNSETDYSVILRCGDISKSDVRKVTPETYSDTVTFNEEECRNHYEDAYRVVKDKLLKNRELVKEYMVYREQDGVLLYGNVEYIFELEDGTGYLLNYSILADEIYYIRYMENMDKYLDTGIDGTLTEVTG